MNNKDLFLAIKTVEGGIKQGKKYDSFNGLVSGIVIDDKRYPFNDPKYFKYCPSPSVLDELPLEQDDFLKKLALKSHQL